MFLAEREPGLIEEMDKEDCDLQKLHNTYRQFRYINRLISKWRQLYKNEIRPILAKQTSTTLLDIGSGGGDITCSIENWALKDGYNLKITAADPDDRAFHYCRENHTDRDIEWVKSTSTELLANGSKFDIVISNHLLHHLTDDEIQNLLSECEQLTTQKVVFNDIERNAIGYSFFNVITRLFFRNSFITKDGLTSIRRSFRKSELEKIIPDNWVVRRSFPFRLILIHEK